ncbi:MAG: ABC transporter ATP-binding protein [Chloroflexia bacterium]|nr:ABC transporter ATP-binding protein [Chloroflexia bacterium]
MSSAVTTRPRSPAEPLLAVAGLSKRYPIATDFFGRPTAWLPAVDDVSLEIRRGETLALVGESGSGKSTLARLILRLIPATAGTIRFDGQNVLAARGKRLLAFRQQAQIIFQDPFESLDPRMKGAAIVGEGMDHLDLGKDARRQRVAELLNLVHLPADAADRFPHEFSGGQRQRLSIARALAVDPSFIVADEPVSALDVSMQSQVLNLMRELQDRLGLTYLFISHDMSVVRHVADRVAVMYLGRVVEIAPADELFTNPLHPYTQALLSAVPSLLTGRHTERIRVTGEAEPLGGEAACRFANRCFRPLEVCRRRVPPLTPIAGNPDHLVACFNPAPLDRAGVVA